MIVVKIIVAMTVFSFCGIVWCEILMLCRNKVLLKAFAENAIKHECA